MSDDDVRALAEEALRLDAEATPGPWETGDGLLKNEAGLFMGPERVMVGALLSKGRDYAVASTGPTSSADSHADAKFIAAARTLLPALARALLAAPVAPASGGALKCPDCEGWKRIAEMSHRLLDVRERHDARMASLGMAPASGGGSDNLCGVCFEHPKAKGGGMCPDCYYLAEPTLPPAPDNPALTGEARDRVASAISVSAPPRAPATTAQDAGHACTGTTAVWCPAHGDCACPPRFPGGDPHERTLDDARCPLHSPTSTHGDAAPPTPEPARAPAGDACTCIPCPPRPDCCTCGWYERVTSSPLDDRISRLLTESDACAAEERAPAGDDDEPHVYQRTGPAVCTYCGRLTSHGFDVLGPGVELRRCPRCAARLLSPVAREDGAMRRDVEHVGAFIDKETLRGIDNTLRASVAAAWRRLALALVGAGTGTHEDGGK